MTAKLTGSIHLYPTHALYRGPLVASASHRHHAGQLIWAPEGVEVTTDHVTRSAVAHLIPPRQRHSHGDARRAVVLWIDRDDACWGHLAELALAEEPSFSRELDTGSAPALAAAMLAWVIPPHAQRRPPRHPAVQRMRRRLDARSRGADGISVTQLAAQSGLSVRQLRHRFTEQIGLSPSGYLRWRRLRDAITAIERGATLTQAALEGGFADGAHFSRVFRAQFGLAPSAALSSLLRA